jgi:hypothetical protein
MAKLHDIEVDDYLRDCVRIEPLALEQEYVRLPADFAYWGERYSVAMRTYLQLEEDTKRTTARLWMETREKLTAAGKKPTEAMIDAAMRQEEEHQKAHAALVGAEAEKERLRVVMEAIRTKREMLVSLGATIRQEKEHDPVIRERVRARQTAENLEG